jgi:hypothetical protein
MINNLSLAQEARRRVVRLAIAFVFFVSFNSSLLSIAQTIPTFHWVYPYLQELQLRHPAMEFDRSRWPVSVLDVDTILNVLDTTSLTNGERFWMKRIEAHRAPWRRLEELVAGVLLTEKLGRFDDKDFRSRLAVRPYVAFAPSPKLLFFNSIRLDQTLKDDPSYLGKKWRAFSGYTEQAYVQWRSRRSSIKFGRDFVAWGRGRDASLLLSDYARPLDQLSFELSVGRLHFSYLAAKLDEVTLSDSLRLRLGAPAAQRYLSANRAAFSFWKNKLQVAVSQAVLYGGPGQNFEPAFLNPFIFLHGEILNGPVDANSFGSIDLVFRPQPRLELYGQLLIDDIQIERTGPGDLEPSEMGFMVGGQVADPFELQGTTIGMEYTRVTNRTYNSPVEFAKFLHRRQPIGHFLGNDFDRWLFFGSSCLGKNFFASWDIERRRRGEGRIEAAFDTPWLSANLDQGYHEKFPSGVVEKAFLATFEVRWHPRQAWFLSLHVAHSRYHSFENQEGAEKNFTEVLVRGWWEINKVLGLE